jgi:hypothetical protein
MGQLDLKVSFSLIISIVSLALSVYVTLRNWRYSETTVRYVARNQSMNALFDIDRQLINRPELWAIYDDHPMAQGRDNGAEAKARRQAFIFFHFNLFESAFNDYNKVLRPTKVDRQYWRSWDAWIHAFFRSSSEARTLLAEASSQQIFFGDFVEYMNEVVRDVEAAAPSASAASAAMPGRLPGGGV